MELPGNFKTSMEELLGEGYEDFAASYDEKPLSGLRVNTSKISTEEFEKKAPFGITKIPLVPNGYYINDTDAWSKHPYYYAGLYYLQEPSAMLPACTLPVEGDDAVLDLCAAPGGKSTQLSLETQGLLVSNDISASRTAPLVRNLQIWGAGNCAVTCEDPQKLAAILPASFDRILVDAPCSGEGMFRRDRKLIASYASKGPAYYAPIQRGILENAYLLLKPGGMMLYSTCTFSDIEDENVIDEFLSSHDDMKPAVIERRDGLIGPYGKYSGIERLEGCVHAFPHLFKGEGHFMALLVKDGTVQRSCDARKNNVFETFSSLPESVRAFFGLFSEGFRAKLQESLFMTALNGNIYMIPKKFPAFYDRSIRYALTGNLLGNISRAGRFIPHTGLSRLPGADDFANRLELVSDGPDIYRYLKGETLVEDSNGHSFTDLSKGYVMICADSFPVGFASYDGSRIKNLYEKGWIYR